MSNGDTFTPSLETRAFGTPLLRFRAKLKEYISDRRKDEGSGRDYMVVKFEFIDLEVLQSVDPYPFPVATIEVGYSSTEKTKWDALAQSIKVLFGRTPVLDEIVGKVQEWHYGDCLLRTKDESDGKWKDLPGQAWQVVQLDGIGSAPEEAANTDELVLNMLDGRNEQDFLQLFYADPTVRANQDLVATATSRQLLPNLEKAGRAWRDDSEVWHRGEKPAS